MPARALNAPSRPGRDWPGIARVLLLVVATVLCYAPSLSGGFLWDDRLLVADDPLIKSPTGLWHIWFSTVPFDYYPLTYTSFWLEWPRWGSDPLGYRAVNLALHLGGALLFWRLLAVWRLPGAWWAALLFALHPLNVASVAWIAERKNVLSLIFVFAALLCWTRSKQGPGAGRRWYLGALAAFALALLSKSSVVMLPGVLLIAVWRQRGRLGRRDVLRTVPFFGLSLVAGLVSIWFQHRAMVPRDLAAVLPLAARVAVVGKALWFYLCRAWYPHPLAMIYPRWELTPLRAADFLPWGAVALLCAAAAWLAVRRGRRGPAAALASFIVAVLPAAGLVPMTLHSLTYVSDHLIHLSLPSMCALGAGALSTPGRARLARRLTLAAVAVAAGILCWQRAGDFGSSERLWRNTLAINPTSLAAQNNYGLALDENGKTQAAEACFRAILRQDPAMPGALTNLAANLQAQRRWPEAAEAYRRALAVSPDAPSFNNYGAVLLYLDDPAGAAQQFREALRLDPTLASAHYNLYKIALSAHDDATAERELRASRELRLVPGR